jgi:two-component system, NarL family, sensor kinase
VTGVSIAIDRPVPAVAAEGARAVPAARFVVLAGGTLIAAALVLVVLVERADLPADGYPTTGRALVRIASSAALLPIGALLLARLPRHPIGWILCIAAMGTALANAGRGYATYSHYVDGLPGGRWAGWVGEWASATILLVPAVALLLFPDGRPPSRRWRPALWAGLAATVLVALEGALGVGGDLEFQGNPFLADVTAKSLGDAMVIGWLIFFPAAIAGVVAIVVRRRAAEGEAREQLRLLERAAFVVLVAFVACAIGSVIAPEAFDVGAVAAILSLTVLAGTMGVAILRHRLYGLDVYVDRALVLAGLTMVLGGLYVGAVLAASSLLGQDVELGVALPATALVAVAFQPVRDRLQRSVDRLLHGQRDEPYAAISTLGRRLGEAMAPAQVLPVMVETIAEALRLPYVAVELSGAPGPPAAAHGTPAAGIALRLPLVHGGERVGTLLIGARAHGESLAAADRRLLEDFARRASAATSAVALSVEVQRSRERLVSAREEERRRLRGDLHDGLGPTLAGAVLTIDAARRVLATDPEAADALLDRAAASVEGTVTDVRRVVYGLRPPALDQLGLVGALRQQAITLSTGGPGLTCDVLAPDPMTPLPAAVEVAAFRIAQEAMTNVARHANAGHVTVTIAVGDTLALEIRDDGDGLAAGHHIGVGLTSMRERATELGGSFAIASPGLGGTTVRVILPLQA